jgi:uncharacterized iron-regulated membrane protein
VAFPGSSYSTLRHDNVFMRGGTALTGRLVRPVLVDAGSGQLTGSRELPWHATALLLSQPLHFGDYGGMPLKILWALLDLVTIVVLCSGLYLWATRRQRVTAAAERRLGRGLVARTGNSPARDRGLHCSARQNASRPTLNARTNEARDVRP